MTLEQLSGQTILYAALDWGFGHVTRSIGIIRELLEQNNQLIIACTNEQKNLFASYFPQIRYVHLDGYNFKFNGKGRWAMDLWKQRSQFFKTIYHEQQFVDQFVQTHPVDYIISDHRYGFFSGKIPSIFVTHQLHLPLSNWFFLVQKWHERQLKNFRQIWVLDDENSSFAGKLSHVIKHKSLSYIGPKSRFLPIEATEILYDYLIVLSGPKPYAAQLFEEITTSVSFSGKKVVVIHPSYLHFETRTDLDFYPATELKKLDKLFYQSETIISRSGYSTIMDIQVLHKKAILLPTKGQKEQEYLASIHPTSQL